MSASFKVRRRMLEAMKECPRDICAPLSFGENAACLLSIFALFALDYKLYHFVYHLAFRQLGLSVKAFWGGLAITSTLITVGLYVYYVELVHLFGRKSSNVDKGDKKKD
jgi:hypothetical protein